MVDLAIHFSFSKTFVVTLPCSNFERMTKSKKCARSCPHFMQFNLSRMLSATMNIANSDLSIIYIYGSHNSINYSF